MGSKWKFICGQPAEARFEWELEVMLTNIRSLCGIPVVVLLTGDVDGTLGRKLTAKYSNIEVYNYENEGVNYGYLPAIRPYLIWRYLDEDREREKCQYFQIDSDVVFREIPKLEILKQVQDDIKTGFRVKPGMTKTTGSRRFARDDTGKDARNDTGDRVVYGSDCEGYLGWGYLKGRTNGLKIAYGFAEILNVPVDVIKNTVGAGAQWVWTAEAGIWWHIWQDSLRLWEFLKPIASDVQKWTAEMWAQLYNFAKFGYRVEIAPELDFCRPTDHIGEWERVKILHNAGVLAGDDGLFYKGAYLDRSPLGIEYKVRADRCSARYVDEMRKVV